VSDSIHLDGPSLQKFIDRVEPDRGGEVAAFRPISGGYSRLSALGTIRWRDGAEETFVLRSDPPPDTGVFDSDRDTEWRFLQAMSGKAPVRTVLPRWYDETGEFFGSKCIVVDFFQGRPLAELGKSPDEIDRARVIFVDTVATIHATALDVLPAAMERPTDWASYIDDLVEHLRTLDAAVPDSNPALHYAAAKLKANRQVEVPLTLVHGDCQPANVLVPESGAPLVIDWEFARVGDPREDLGYYSRLPVPPNLYETGPDAFLARYRERTGLSEEQVNPQTVEYFFLLGMARLLGQMLHSAESLAQGHPRGVMATYLLNGTSATMRRFFDITRRIAG